LEAFDTASKVDELLAFVFILAKKSLAIESSFAEITAKENKNIKAKSFLLVNLIIFDPNLNH
jgi:hypothetical protein